MSQREKKTKTQRLNKQKESWHSCALDPRHYANTNQSVTVETLLLKESVLQTSNFNSCIT